MEMSASTRPARFSLDARDADTRRRRSARAGATPRGRATCVPGPPARVADGPRRTAPPVEPPSRRARIEPARAANVLTDVLQHVDERVSHLARRAQASGVIPVSPDAPTATEHAVRSLRHPDPEAAHPAHEGRRPVR